ncbi:hypothetical protein PQ460_10835 [Paenibacillus sp. KACC 21273]|uniref:hypothetical protein n=1 Tax=Paenibacillus sp. KACC 21273 TaxID=3025665 RepID=UPI0023659F70|nr:hypothetical protein [Paenibacillus sp. KACC 21273]WDF52879.1 hypothetical protein PQ460_10835 [Paenibacillus sp. KACC 21273]
MKLNNEVTFELRLRKKWNIMIYYTPVTTINNYIYPCNVYLFKNGEFRLATNKFFIKDSLIDGDYIVVCVEGYKPFLLSRYEVSHVVGPFKYDEISSITKAKAAAIKGTSIQYMESKFKDSEDIPIYLFQKYFGVLETVPYTERYQNIEIVRGLRENGILYRDNWLEDEVIKIKNDYSMLIKTFYEQRMHRDMKILKYYLDSNDYKKRLENTQQSIDTEKENEKELLSLFDSFISNSKHN